MFNSYELPALFVVRYKCLVLRLQNRPTIYKSTRTTDLDSNVQKVRRGTIKRSLLVVATFMCPDYYASGFERVRVKLLFLSFALCILYLHFCFFTFFLLLLMYINLELNGVKMLVETTKLFLVMRN